MNAFRHLLVSTKVTLANIVGMLILSGAVLLVIAQVLKADLGRQAIDMQRLGMEVAWSALHEAGREISIRDGQLRVGETVLNGNNAIVDKIKRVTGGTATIFQGDTRIATNVLKPDGARAVGTTLAKGPAYDAVFSRGESYRGPVDILGKRYYAAYDPLKDQSGKVVGVLYVGLKEDDLFRSFDHSMMLASGGTVLLVVLLGLPGYVLLRRLLKPLGTLRAAMEALSGGNTDTAIEGLQRHDEIGDMARAVVVFRDSMIEAQRLRSERERQQAEAEAQKVQALEHMASRIEQESRDAVNRVAEQTTMMEQNAQAMATSAELVSQKSQGVAAAADQSYTNAQTVAAATEQLTASIQGISGQVIQASTLSRRAVTAGQGNADHDPVPVRDRHPDRQRGPSHPGDREPDQPSRPQCHDRSRPGRGGGQGLRRRGIRGQEPGDADGPFHRGDHATHSRHPGGDHKGGGVGDGHECRHPRDQHRVRRRHLRHGGAGDRHAGDRPERQPDRGRGPGRLHADCRDLAGGRRDGPACRGSPERGERCRGQHRWPADGADPGCPDRNRRGGSSAAYPPCHGRSVPCQDA
jgi:methyl-accepting chemotaxis protein